MLEIDTEGMIDHSRIIKKRYTEIERGPMTLIAGIIVHQTDSPTAQSTFNGYAVGKNGAHFLIDRDGTVYQTASLTQTTWHVGKIRSRCIAEKRCTPQENKLEKTWNTAATHERQMKKQVPDRYPANTDSLGIEIVGQALPLTALEKDKVFESLSNEQKLSLKWLVTQLSAQLNISPSEIFRHSEISYKNTTEAKDAAW